MSKVIKVAFTASDKNGISIMNGAAFAADISETIPRNVAVPSGLKFVNLRFAVPANQVEDFQAALETGSVELVVDGALSGVERAISQTA